MIHLLFGAEPFLIQEHKNTLLAGVEPFSISIIDMRETSIQAAIDEAKTRDLFGDKKTMILRDCYFLTGEVVKNKIDHNVEVLIEYLKNPNPDTKLIIIVNNEKLDKRKKVVKDLLKVAITFEAKPLRYVQSWLQERFKREGKTLTTKAADLMQQQIGTDLFLLHSEMQKVCITYPNHEIIDDEMLDGVITHTLESNVFLLVDRIIKRQASAIELLEDMFRLGEEPIMITLLIARQFRIIHSVKALQEVGQKPSSVLKMAPYALQIAEEQAEEYTLEEIQDRLQTCAELDVAMKRGEVDKHIALETLILKWI